MRAHASMSRRWNRLLGGQSAGVSTLGTVTDDPGAAHDAASDGEASTGVVKLAETMGKFLGALLVPIFVVLAFGLIGVIPAGLVWGIIEAYPGQVEQKANPGWFETIFGSTAVLWGARIVLLALAVVLLISGTYIALSAVVRIKRAEWLHKAGPFEARLKEAEETLDEGFDTLLASYGEALETNEDLEQRLEASNQGLTEAYEQMQAIHELWQEGQDEADALRVENARLRSRLEDA